MNFIVKKNAQGGFTYLELLVVLSIIGLLVAVILTYVDPLEKFRQTEKVRSWLSANNLVEAIKIAQIDRSGQLPPPVSSAIKNRNYMISYSANPNLLPQCNNNCPQVFNEFSCLNMYNSMVFKDGYMKVIPIAPIGTHQWGPDYTGYYLTRGGHDEITVTACEDPEITITK